MKEYSAFVKAEMYLKLFDSDKFSLKDYKKIYYNEPISLYHYFNQGLTDRLMNNGIYKKYMFNEYQLYAASMCWMKQCRKCGLWNKYSEGIKIPCSGCIQYKKYKKHLLKTRPILCDETHDCPICFSTMEKNTYVSKLTCNHHYHQDCISNWIKIKNTCPLCRTTII